MEERERFDRIREKEAEEKKRQEDLNEVHGHLEQLREAVNEAVNGMKSKDDDSKSSGKEVLEEIPILDDNGKVINIKNVHIPADLYERKMMLELSDRREIRAADKSGDPRESELMKSIKEDMQNVQASLKEERDRREAQEKQFSDELLKRDKDREKEERRREKEQHDKELRSLEGRHKENIDRLEKKIGEESGKTPSEERIAIKEIDLERERMDRLYSGFNHRLDRLNDTVLLLAEKGPNREKPKVATKQWDKDEEDVLMDGLDDD